MSVPSVADNRIRRLLEEEQVVWLSTVRPDGSPHLVPVWFWWDGEAVIVFSKPHAQKVRNLEDNPAVMLALGEPDEDFDVGLVRGRAECLAMPTAEVLPVGFLEKYADRMDAIGLDAAEFATTYSRVVRIVPAQSLPWHGRTTPHSERVAGAPAASIVEPVRDAVAAFRGEPVSQPWASASRPGRRWGLSRLGELIHQGWHALVRTPGAGASPA